MRRSLAVLTALALAVFGTVVLVAYVRSADARAEAGATLVPVLVVEEDVPAGTSVEDLADSVSTAQVPSRLKALGAIDDLAAVDGLTTTADLLAGDQVMAARFGDPSVVEAGDGPDVPADMQEVSLALDPQRAVGGVLAAGDRVGVYISAAATDAAAAATTGLTVDRALVTRVSGTDTSTIQTSGTTTVTVTLALGTSDAAAVIAGMEVGTVWLSLQETADSADTSLTSTSTSTGDDQ